MSKNRQSVDELLRRLGRLPPHEVPKRLQQQADLLGISGSEILRTIVQNQLDAELRECPFRTPDRDAGLDLGDHPILETPKGLSVRISSIQGRPNAVSHVFLAGQSLSGKSTMQGVLALACAADSYCLIIDSKRHFRRMPAIRSAFTIAGADDARLNPFDDDHSDMPAQRHAAHIHEFCDCTDLKFAQFEIAEMVRELGEKDLPINLTQISQSLRKKKYPGFTNRSRYRDSAVLVIESMLNGCPTFQAARGMNLAALLRNQLVLEIDMMLPRHTSYLLRSLFVSLEALGKSARRLDKPLRLFIDEGQHLAHTPGFAGRIIDIRHANIFVAINAQNPSTLSPELLGNCDAFFVFQLSDGRDRDEIGRVLNLNHRQRDYLGLLEPGTCVCYLPRSQWKLPFIATVPRVEFDTGDDAVRESGRDFLSQFDWTPLAEDEPIDGAADTDMDEATERFLRDVLNQIHEASALTARFERAGVRSASKQGQVIRKLCAGGFIKIHALAVGRGRPLKLVEPTSVSFEKFDVKWRKTRGSLPVRVATTLLEKKFKALEGWSCVREGVLRYGDVEKAVDLLLRDSANRIVTLEVAGNAEHEVHNALHCVRCSEVRKHVVVCLNKKILEAVKSKFSGFDELVGDERVVLMTLSQALRDAWVP